MARTDALVDSAWLAAHLRDPHVRVVDASWYLPSAGRDPQAEYDAAHIPGAVFFDIDAVSDRASDLPHMLPDLSAFEEAVGELGIGSDDRVVVYDGAGLLSAPRVWWTFRVFGHDAVSVLDGGLPAWRGDGRPVEAGPAVVKPSVFTANYRPELVRSLAEMRVSDAVVVDARSRGRFMGTAPEPRPGVRGGHMPDSRNVPYTELIENGRLKSEEGLMAVFAAAGVDVRGDVNTTCGSGITASVLALALFVVGNRRAAVYDGSWAEWGGREDTPVVS